MRKLTGARAVTGVAAALLLSAAASAEPVKVRVTIENLAPANGTLLTPLWVGFHNGGFDTYDRGEPAAPFLERLAEDGNTGPISDVFSAIGAGQTQGALFGPGGPIAPGESATASFTIEDGSRYFSYGAMVIPSNDAFIANGSPTAHEIIDGAGNFLGADFVISGANVLDAGTEVNDEVPANTAAFGQMAENTGVDEFGRVELHAGFMPAGAGGILDDPQFSGADFSIPGLQIARITVAPVPIPAALVLMLSAMGGLAIFRRRISPAPV